MRKKWILTFILAILALPIFSVSASADEAVVYEDGNHPITAKAINADTGEPSGAASFLKEGAKLNIKDGAATLTITVPHNSMAEITGLQIEGNEPVVTEGDAVRYLAFKLEKVKSEYNATVSYEVPSIGMVHNDVAFKFVLEGLENIPGVKENEPEPTEPDEDTSEPVEPEEENQVGLANLADGYYTINGSYLHMEEEKASSMARYLDGLLFLEVENGKVELTVTVNADETVTLLKIDDKNAVEKKVDGKKRYETFKFDSLKSLYNAYVEYQAPMGNGKIHYGKADFRIQLDETSIQETESSNKPGLGIPENDENPVEPGKPEEPTKPEQPVEDDGDNIEEPKQDENANKDNKENEKPKTPDKKDQLTPDKAYKIDFVIKHETDDKPSAADSFFKGPAILLEKDGERYVQITVTGSNFINSLKTKHGDMVVVKVNEDDSIVVQLKVDGKLSDVIELDMMITVPGVYENQEHQARLFLTESNMEEIAVSDYRLVASNNGNGPTVEGESGENNLLPGAKNNKSTTDNTKTNNDPTIEKPELGNEKNGSKNDVKVAGQEKNPQTGDTTNILLYVVLLIGSAIPLAIMAKRRFANAA